MEYGTKEAVIEQFYMTDDRGTESKSIIKGSEFTDVYKRQDIDRVVHFAAESHVDRSIRNPEVFVQTNVLGTAVMLNLSLIHI